MRIVPTILIFFSFLFSGFVIGAEDDCFPSPQKPPRLVNDFAGVIPKGKAAALEQKLVAFNDTTSTQIAVVIVKDLCGYDKSEFTYTLGEKWGVGQKGFDNGILIMVKPTGRKGNRHAFIATGYGLEGAVPDAIAKRIVENEMIPRFKKNDYAGGIEAAANVLMKLTTGEFTAKQYKKNTSGKPPALMALLPLLIIIFFVFFGAARRAKKYSVGHDVPFWTALFILSSSGRSHGGHYNSFSSGSGSFGGGGGGFGGFGGGSFGGGGAGGSW